MVSAKYCLLYSSFIWTSKDIGVENNISILWLCVGYLLKTSYYFPSSVSPKEGGWSLSRQ